jgi:deoxyribonuclease-4
MLKIKLGPAGSPKKSTIEGIEFVKKVGLQALEVEYVRGVHMSLELAKQVGELAKKLNIKLSVHAPYFINLSSKEKKKIEESKKRIFMSCERAGLMGAKVVVFHPGYYMEQDKKQVFSMIKDACDDLVKEMHEKNIKNVNLALETSGKVNSFGTIQEIINICKHNKRCIPCIDFAHIYAYNKGKIDYSDVFDLFKILKLEHYHCHFSGIQFSEKGERNHINMSKPDFNELAREILKRKLNITIISESPITYLDSLKQKKILNSLGYKF